MIVCCWDVLVVVSWDGLCCRVQVQDLPAIVLSPAQYYNYTQPRGNFIPTSLADKQQSSDQSAVTWWSRDASARRLLGTFHLASGVAATCVLRSALNSSFDTDRLRSVNFTSRSQRLVERYFEPGCESVFVRGLPLMNFVPPATVIIDTANSSFTPLNSGMSRDSDHAHVTYMSHVTPFARYCGHVTIRGSAHLYWSRDYGKVTCIEGGLQCWVSIITVDIRLLLCLHCDVRNLFELGSAFCQWCLFTNYTT